MKKDLLRLLILLFPFSLSSNPIGNSSNSNHMALFGAATALAGATIIGCSYVGRHLTDFYDRSMERIITEPTPFNRFTHRILTVIEPQAATKFVSKKLQSSSHWFSKAQPQQSYSVDQFLCQVPEQKIRLQQQIYGLILDPEKNPYSLDPKTIDRFVRQVHKDQPDFQPTKSNFTAACALQASHVAKKLLKRKPTLDIDADSLKATCTSGIDQTLDLLIKHNSDIRLTDNHLSVACESGNASVVGKILALNKTLRPKRSHWEKIVQQKDRQKREDTVRIVVKANPSLKNYGHYLLQADFVNNFFNPEENFPDFSSAILSLIDSGNATTLHALLALNPALYQYDTKMIERACISNSSRTVQLIVTLANPKKLEYTDLSLQTACDNGNAEIVDILFSKCTHPYYKTLVSQITAWTPSDTEKMNELSNTLLTAACKSGNTATVRILLNNISTLTPNEGHFKLAYKHGDITMINLLIERNPKFKPNGQCFIHALSSASSSSLLLESIAKHNPQIKPYFILLDGTKTMVKLLRDREPKPVMTTITPLLTQKQIDALEKKLEEVRAFTKTFRSQAEKIRSGLKANKAQLRINATRLRSLESVERMPSERGLWQKPLTSSRANQPHPLIIGLTIPSEKTIQDLVSKIMVENPPPIVKLLDECVTLALIHSGQESTIKQLACIYRYLIDKQTWEETIDSTEEIPLDIEKLIKGFADLS